MGRMGSQPTVYWIFLCFFFPCHLIVHGRIFVSFFFSFVTRVVVFVYFYFSGVVNEAKGFSQSVFDLGICFTNFSLEPYPP